MNQVWQFIMSISIFLHPLLFSSSELEFMMPLVCFHCHMVHTHVVLFFFFGCMIETTIKMLGQSYYVIWFIIGKKKHHRSDSWDDHTKIKKCASWFFSSLPNFHWFSFKKIKVFPSWKIEILLPASLCKLSQNYLFIYLFFISFFESED